MIVNHRSNEMVFFVVVERKTKFSRQRAENELGIHSKNEREREGGIEREREDRAKQNKYAQNRVAQLATDTFSYLIFFFFCSPFFFLLTKFCVGSS